MSHWLESSSFEGEDQTFNRGSFLGGERVMCSRAAATVHSQCRSWSITSVCELVFGGPDCEREAAKSGWLMGHLPHSGVGTQAGSFAQAAFNSRCKANPCHCSTSS